MKQLTATVVSVHAGKNDDMSKDLRDSIHAELAGFVEDAHRGYERRCWSGDKQAENTVRRNERQWSAIAIEELEQISSDMGLTETIGADTIGVNLCIRGVDHFSRLPKGSVLKFPSGAELVVVEFNPPCLGMGKKLAGLYKKRSGESLANTEFSKAAKLSRGLVGVIDVPGEISTGDEVSITLYEHPSWLAADWG